MTGSRIILIPSGARGPAGATGATGAPGPQGAPGATGTAGATGAAGADGKTVRSGSGAPSAGLGVDGDFYINTVANTIYGPKASGSWGSPTSLVGPTGATGAPGATGATGPAGSGVKTPANPSGAYVIPGFVFWSQNSTLALASNTAVIRPLPIASATTLTSVAVEVTATGTATAMRVGIYSLSNNADYFSTPTLVSELGTMNVSGTGSVTLTGLSVSLSANSRYLVLLLANGSVTLRAPFGNPTDYYTTGSSASGYYSAWSGGTITYGALPSTFTPSVGAASNNHMNYPIFYRLTVA